MSELAQKSREAMKAKIARLIDSTPGKVDSSDYGPEETDHSGEKKTNVKRPINPRAFKRGGAVAEGDKPRPNAGKTQRKARADGGAMDSKRKAPAEPVPRPKPVPAPRKKNVDIYPNEPYEPKPTSGPDVETTPYGFKRGGKAKHDDAAEDRALVKSMVKKDCRTARADGGAAYDPNKGSPFTLHHRESGKQVGGPYNDIKRARSAKDRKDNAYGSYAHGIRDSEGRNRYKDGGRTARSTGGDIGLGLLSPAGLAAKELLGKASGGRTAHAAGGRTKGKTNVNVIIATGPQGGQPGMQPPMGAAPVPPPMPSPNAAMPGTSPMPGGPPPAALAAGVPPMPRKRGGRTAYPIETGSGGGRARLDKKDAY